MLDIGVELVVAEARQAEREVQLQEADVCRISKACPVQGDHGFEPGFLVHRGQEFDPSLRHAGHDRNDLRVVQRLEQGGVDAVRLQFMGDTAEQFREALARIGDAFDLAEDFAFAVFFPAFERCW